MYNRRTLLGFSAAITSFFFSSLRGKKTMAQETTSSTTNISRNPTGTTYTRRTMEIPAGSRILFISGQTATDENGNTPADAETQADIVYGKVGDSLRDAGMDWSDVVKTNVYLVNPSDVGAIYKAGGKHNPGGPQAGTLVYVKGLFDPAVLIELEAVAAKKDE